MMMMVLPVETAIVVVLSDCAHILSVFFVFPSKVLVLCSFITYLACKLRTYFLLSFLALTRLYVLLIQKFTSVLLPEYKQVFSQFYINYHVWPSDYHSLLHHLQQSMVFMEYLFLTLFNKLTVPSVDTLYSTLCLSSHLFIVHVTI